MAVTAVSLRCCKISSQIEVYIEKQKSPLKEILREVQKIFRETLPNSKEEMRWGAITFASGKFYLAAMKNRVHVGFAITGLSDDKLALFEGKGRTMRHIKIFKVEEIDKSSLSTIITMVDQQATCLPC